ncbi:MAG: PhzF family phenazine biosynthesis protein [Desulfovibrio sp.]|uniref:PhzF family phenazine biosynthesis protein n=1 Tax=Desulfovibrio sp. TaxID=885 RepID=UPI00135E3D40|nr:PhzF family phenazine biosynthesis protein [Desulfovibrio sp.]
MLYFHADVFCKEPMTGNGLTVIVADTFPQSDVMQRMAQEFRQFETIFLVQRGQSVFDARIFTVEEELDFAGHPILGAAAVVRQEFMCDDTGIVFNLNSRQVSVTCKQQGLAFHSCMDQGPAEFVRSLEPEIYQQFLRPLNLSQCHVSAGYPLQVVSTGLPYLLVPITSGLAQARIVTADYESQLAQIGAKFAYVFDVNAVEGRTWDNAGQVEDVATGSAAGPVGAYLYRHGRFAARDPITLRQGRFVGRDSEIHVCAQATTGNMLVSGEVRILVRGSLAKMQ